MTRSTSRSTSPVPYFSRQNWARPKPKTITKRELEAMVRQRDEQIAALEAERSIAVQALTNSQSELDDFREMYNEETLWLGLKVQALDRDRETMAEQIGVLNQDMSAEALLEKYSEVIKRSSSKRKAKVYVSDLEAQLCKAMHKLEVMSKQLKVVTSRCEMTVRSTKEEMGEVIQEKIKTESELTRKLAKAEHERELIETEYRSRLRHRENTIENLAFEVEQLQGKIDVLEQYEYENGMKQQQHRGRVIGTESSQTRQKAKASVPEWKHSFIHSPPRDRLDDRPGDLTSSDVSSDEDSIVTLRRGDLFVSGWDATNIPSTSDLAQIFKKVGPLSKVEVSNDGTFALISYVKSNNAKKAVRRYHGVAKISGKVLSVDLSRPVVLYDGDILVHGWDAVSEMREEDLLKMFQPYGLIDNIDFGEHKDYAIIAFYDPTSAQRAAEEFNNGTNAGSVELKVVRP